MTAEPPGRMIYLTFHHNVSKRHKREARNFGDSRSRSRVLAASLMVLTIGNRVNSHFSIEGNNWDLNGGVRVSDRLKSQKVHFNSVPSAVQLALDTV